MKSCKIFAKTIEQEATDQINTLYESVLGEKCSVRIMPDVHAGKGCVIGLTMQWDKQPEKICPNLVGVDIGCGMLTAKIKGVKAKDVDLKKLDSLIHSNIPSGESIHKISFYEKTCRQLLESLECFEFLKCATDEKSLQRVLLSVGTLGGGNHFIELAKNDQDDVYVVIHSGSRNLGVQVATHYQKIAEKNWWKSCEHEKEKFSNNFKQSHNMTESLVKSAFFDLLREIGTKYAEFPKDLYYLTNQNAIDYLNDTILCQKYAVLNRKTMLELILQGMDWECETSFETLHNYVELNETKTTLRKGAVSAKLNENLLIPLNMRDGSLICKGKGNEDWNCSAPHGAGRLMSRSQANKNLKLEDFQKEMVNVYSTCVQEDTLDEAPMAYKNSDEIKDLVQQTAEIIEHIKPIYNFKATKNILYK